MVKTIGEIFQNYSNPISGILFLGNWPEKHILLWKGQFLIIIFLEIWGQIQIPLKKVCIQTALLFSKFSWEVGQTKQKCSFLKVSLTYPRFLRFFTYLTNFQLEFWKKESSFWEESESGLRFLKIWFLKIDLSIGMSIFGVNLTQTICQSK